MAEDIVKQLLAASASPLHQLHALWTATKMASERTRMFTRQNLLALSFTSWLELSASDWWIDLFDTARAIEWLT